MLHLPRGIKLLRTLVHRRGFPIERWQHQHSGSTNPAEVDARQVAVRTVQVVPAIKLRNFANFCDDSTLAKVFQVVLRLPFELTAKLRLD